MAPREAHESSTTREHAMFSQATSWETLQYPALDESRACLLEHTEPFELPTGEKRRYLEDGDEVVFKGRARREGYVAIGFGECRARVARNLEL